MTDVSAGIPQWAGPTWEVFGDLGSWPQAAAVLAARAQWSANRAEASRDHCADPVLIASYDQAARTLRRHATELRTAAGQLERGTPL